MTKRIVIKEDPIVHFFLFLAQLKAKTGRLLSNEGGRRMGESLSTRSRPWLWSKRGHQERGRRDRKPPPSLGSVEAGRPKLRIRQSATYK